KKNKKNIIRIRLRKRGKSPFSSQVQASGSWLYTHDEDNLTCIVIQNQNEKLRRPKRYVQFGWSCRRP
ncbi:hypothetical protein LINPERPRIM_LOCUS14521, partial [Linum perenne]